MSVGHCTSSASSVRAASRQRPSSHVAIGGGVRRLSLVERERVECRDSTPGAVEVRNVGRHERQVGQEHLRHRHRRVLRGQLLSHPEHVGVIPQQ